MYYFDYPQYEKEDFVKEVELHVFEWKSKVQEKSAENIGPEKKFESEFTSTFVDPTNLINSVDLCKQLNFSILG